LSTKIEIEVDYLCIFIGSILILSCEISYYYNSIKSRWVVLLWGGGYMVRFGVRICLTCCVVLYSTYVCAVGIPEKKPENWGAEQGDDIPLVEPGSQQVIDDAQVEASALLYEVSEWIDSFFDDGRFTEEENESRATLKLSVGYSRHDEIEIQPRILMMAGRIVQPMTLRPILMRISFFAQPPLSTIMKPKMAFPTPSNSVCIRC